MWKEAHLQTKDKISISPTIFMLKRFMRPLSQCNPTYRGQATICLVKIIRRAQHEVSWFKFCKRCVTVKDLGGH